MFATTERCDISTPLAAPVVPELNMISARSSSAAGAGSNGRWPSPSTRDRTSAKVTRVRSGPRSRSVIASAGTTWPDRVPNLLVAPPGVPEGGDGTENLQGPERHDPFDAVEAEQEHAVARADAACLQVRGDPGDGAFVAGAGQPAIALHQVLPVTPAAGVEQQVGDRARPARVDQAGMPGHDGAFYLTAPHFPGLRHHDRG